MFYKLKKKSPWMMLQSLSMTIFSVAYLKATLPAQEPLTLFFLVVCSSYADFSQARLYTFIVANVAQECIIL